MDAAGKPYPTKLGIHGSHVAVDWETCIADGACMDVCPVTLYEWELNPGQMGTGNDKKIEKGTPEWDKYRTDKCDPVRESECIFCMACESVCPTRAIKITP
jgi:NAD-dependent dihydropyrimidine dehydrogenase PreA subunit